MYRVVVYASPGYMDKWSIRYWLYRVTTALKRARDWTQIYILGSGAQDAVEGFCRDFGYHLFYREAPRAKDAKGEIDKLKEALSPDVLLAFTRGGEVVWEYATLAIEEGIHTILTANLSGGETT